MSGQHHPLADFLLIKSFPEDSIFIIMKLIEEQGIKTVIHLFFYFSR
jgi:hypothetical protein